MVFSRCWKRTGFTLIELLIVLAIIGTLVLIVVPQVGEGMATTKIATAARSVAQASRYARTMALLNQTETELVLYGNGSIEVRAALVTSQRMHNAALERKAAAELAADGFSDTAADDSVSATNSPVDVATSLAMADEIGTKFENENMTFEFVGYTDSVDEEEEIRITDDSGDEEEDEFSSKPKSSVIATVLYESNGICRPYHVRVIYDEDLAVDVFVDLTGVGKVVTSEDEI